MGNDHRRHSELRESRQDLSRVFDFCEIDSASILTINENTVVEYQSGPEGLFFLSNASGLLEAAPWRASQVRLELRNCGNGFWPAGYGLRRISQPRLRRGRIPTTSRN